MANGDRCLLVHGHFYQPPRENPWTGKIEPQHSAAPWENWNRRIADECYLPMARSRVHDAAGKVADLYNNYAHTSFNFGPTLLSWVKEEHPTLIRHLADAAAIDSTFAMAQAYGHMILPLADTRDRHIQILWGLREFRHRFGFYPEGMWLPECAIDPETVRALVDHRVRFVILSPHQASKARAFGRSDWQDVSMGAIDTRRAYRIFDLDGGGRTHFDRHLDVVFYTPGLNLKVSFDHILNRPDDLARELERCYLPEYPGAQLVSIVTDGEIYGHHEKRGEEALTRLFHDIAPSLGLKVVSAGRFIRENPPDWEVKLWNGDDRRGSSWSCQHGVGRWYSDCGCRPPTPPGWNQSWRGPLRDAFDAVRDRVRAIARRELGGLVWDLDDAAGDYVSVLLEPTPESRRRFLLRHAQRRLDSGEIAKLWRVLEALRNAMLMYASCAWFFDELSGLEPVQSMRYALRAVDLVRPYGEEDLAPLLERELSKAQSNIGHYRDGAQVFRELAAPTRHGDRELAAAMAACLAAGFPIDSLSWRLVEKTETVNYVDSDGNRLSWGSFVCYDGCLDRYLKTSWAARIDDFENTAVGLRGFEEAQGDPVDAPGVCPFRPDADFSWLRDIESKHKGKTRQELMEYLDGVVLPLGRLPSAVRGMFYRKFSEREENALMAEAARMGTRAVPFLERARRHGARVPDAVVTAITSAFEQEMAQGVDAAIAGMDFGDKAAGMLEGPMESARKLGIHPSLEPLRQSLFATGMELLHWLSRLTERGWFESLRPEELEGRGLWLAPCAPVARSLAYPSAGALAVALGRGLATLWSGLRAEADPARAALTILPLPELLAYGARLGLDPGRATGLGIEFWDFTAKPLSRLLKQDPEAFLSGPQGERLRQTGDLLGFAPQTLRLRVEAAGGR